MDFSRSEAVLGADAMARLRAARVLVVGVGGVGGPCCEVLVRTGLGHITLVDDDVVQASNVNRQIQATERTLGQSKTDALAARLRAIDPEVAVKAVNRRFSVEDGFAPDDCDCIVDAIDSVAEKAALIRAAHAVRIPIVSSLGAALRTDPTKVAILPFDRVTGDGLARALRQRFRGDGYPLPAHPCVCSTERPLDLPTRGSLMPVTATFGCVLAACVLRIVTQPPADADDLTLTL